MLTSQIIESVKKSLHLLLTYGSKLESYFVSNNSSDDVKVKKTMLLYYTYALVVYGLFFAIFAPFGSREKYLAFMLIASIQLALLRAKNYYFVSVFTAIYTLLLLYLPTLNESEFLRLHALALIYHNYFIMLPRNTPLRLMYFTCCVLIIMSTKKRLFVFIEEGNFDKLETLVRNFYFSYPSIFLINHLASFYLLKSYEKIQNQNNLIRNQLEHTNQKLLEANKKLSETLSELENKNRKLAEAIKARELFIAGVSHELRNPLNAMMGNIELLILDTVSPKWLEMLETCKVCGEMLLGLINNVLDVAKINAEKLEIHVLPSNFYRLMEKVWTVSTMRITQKGLEGTLNISRSFPKYIEIDSHRLIQILLNLIGNASKFTNKGFVKVFVNWYESEENRSIKEPHYEYQRLVSTAKAVSEEDRKGGESAGNIFETSPNSREIQNTSLQDLFSRCEEKIVLNPSRCLAPRPFSEVRSHKYITLSSSDFHIYNIPVTVSKNDQRKKGFIKIDIIDSGCGISEAALQKLFQPFAQADSSITRRFGGTGLGLYITQEILHKMGGKIYVHSEVNIGTNFGIVIPAETITLEEVHEKLHEELDEVKLQQQQSENRFFENNFAEEMQGAKVLIVDDGPSNRLVVSSYLQKLGIDYEMACDGKEAVEMFISKGINHYSFITMDLQMPRMDGLTAMRKIREYERELGMDYRNYIPICVVTGNCTNEEKKECLDKNGDIQANYFYRKPFSYEECKNVVQSIFKAQVSSPVRSPTKKKKKVLIVDDDPFNQKVMQDYLEKYKFRYDICSNGGQAVEKINSGEIYDAVLMDCEMPYMDGYTATKCILEADPDLLIIGVTGNSDGKYIDKALKSGMKYVETKPVNFKKVLSLISGL